MLEHNSVGVISQELLRRIENGADGVVHIAARRTLLHQKGNVRLVLEFVIEDLRLTFGHMVFREL